MNDEQLRAAIARINELSDLAAESASRARTRGDESAALVHDGQVSGFTRALAAITWAQA